MLLKTLHNIQFPVYKLRAHERVYTNPLGLLIIEGFKKDWVLDHTILEGNYASRRVQLKTIGRDVYPLSDKCDTFSYIVQYPSGTSFIDSNGRVFIYSRAGKYWDLVYHTITSMEFVSGGNTKVMVHKILQPFIFNTVIDTRVKYLGLLSKFGMYIPYDLSVERKESTRRMI